MITNLHKIIIIWPIIWSLLTFAMVFLKLAYLLCVQIVRKQQCLDICFSIFWSKAGRYCCLEYIYVKKRILKILVITSFCRGRTDEISPTLTSDPQTYHFQIVKSQMTWPIFKILTLILYFTATRNMTNNSPILDMDIQLYCVKEIQCPWFTLKSKPI